MYRILIFNYILSCSCGQTKSVVSFFIAHKKKAVW